MIFAIYALLVLIFLYLLQQSLPAIQRCVRYWRMMEKLPTAAHRRIFLGHLGRAFGLKMHEVYCFGRELNLTSGPVYTYYIGPVFPTVNILEAETNEILLGSMKHLEKADIYRFLHRWLEEGLLTSKDSKWQQRRKILTPAFHFSILLSFLEIFNRETTNFLKIVEANHLNKPVDVVPIISDYTLQTLSETSMGVKLDVNTKEGTTYKNAIMQLSEVVYNRFMNPFMWSQTIFDLSPNRKKEAQALKLLHGFTNYVIRKRGENFKTFDETFTGNTTSKRKYPLLDVLLNSKIKNNSIDDKGIREEVDTFMFEGHDTTATCLSFTCMLLACNKDIQEEAYQEIISILGSDLSKNPTNADLQQMNLLERCIKESLRLYPPVPMIGRTASEDLTTNHGVIPKGSLILCHILDTQRKPEYWLNPEKFDPSRFLPENSQGRHPFAYIPFSAGARNCIGQKFAMMEIKSFFCGVLRKFMLEPVDTPESLVFLQDLLLRSKDGIRVKFVLRST